MFRLYLRELLINHHPKIRISDNDDFELLIDHKFKGKIKVLKEVKNEK